MRISNVKYDKLGFFLTLLLVSSICHAEIYKWVDANGQTHFSERKDGAGQAKVVELKANSQPASTHANKSFSQYWQEQEILFKQRQLPDPAKKPSGPSLATKPKSLSGGTSDESDTSRCNLARDVLSGAVRHSNGTPTDKYDREIAENDVRAYCH